MSGKKMVGRSVAVALGIVCIILVAGIGGAMAYYTMQIDDKNNQIDSVKAQLATITGNNTSSNATQVVAQLEAWLAGNITAYNSLQSTYNAYVASHSHTDDQYNGYANDHSYTNEQYQDLQSQISSLNAQITNLQNQYNNYVSDHSYTNEQYNLLTVASLSTVALDVSNFNHYYTWDPASHLTINGYIFNMGTSTAYNCKLHVRVWSDTSTLLIDTTIDYGTISGRTYASISHNTEVPYTGSGSYWDVTPQWTSS